MRPSLCPQARLAVALLLLAGCTPQGGSNPATGAASVAQPIPGFSCPPPGTAVTYDSGRQTTFQGADPADPALCISTTATGTQQRQLFGFFADGTPSYATIRSGMARLYPLAIGRSADFVTVHTVGAGRGAGLDTQQYREVFTIRGEERIAVGDQQVDTWVMSRRQEGMGGNSFRGTDTFWIDKATGVYLRRMVNETFGQTRATPYTATALRRAN